MPVLSLVCIQLISALIGLSFAVKFQLIVPKIVDLNSVRTPIFLFAGLIAFTAYSIDLNILFVAVMFRFFQIPFLFAINYILNKKFSTNQLKFYVVMFILVLL